MAKEATTPPSLLASAATAFTRVEENLNRVMVGQAYMVRLLLTALIARGHVLLEDVPGTGKTVMVKALARSVDVSFRRIQGTADLLPSDITGVTVYDQSSGLFVFQPGPIFANLVLVDEINRASPRTQSALLESMAEGQVTSELGTRPLPSPHFVVATQNPVDFHGTYTLPLAQLDRFWMVVAMDHLQKADVVRMMQEREHIEPLETIGPVATVVDVIQLQNACAEVTIADGIRAYTSDLHEALSSHQDITLAPSLRAILHLQRLAQATAMINGRAYVLPDDVKKLIIPAFSHRIVVRPRGPRADAIIDEVVERTPLPLR